MAGLSVNDRILQRDVEASVIPSGEPALLPSGATVNITHRLGGNFTVVCDLGMFRIQGKDADALGEEVETHTIEKKYESNEYGAIGTAEHPGFSGEPDKEMIWKELRNVYDPEIPVDIVNLGLIYSMEVNKLENGKYSVRIVMTLTAPGCGMGPVIAEDACNRVLSVPGVSEAKIEIVFEPFWTQDMISEEGKMELGLI